MPRFDFYCQACNFTFEAPLPFGSKKIPACPTCGAKKTEKLIAPPGIVFKGAGWYKTDGRAAEPTAETKKEEKKEALKPSETKPAPSTAERKNGV